MKNYTSINVILDRSGSMQTIREDIIGGFNSFINKQKELVADEARISLAQFDDRYDIVYQDIRIQEAPPLILEPRHSTALYDALGRTIDNLGWRLANLPETERPNRVVVLVLTDGEENSSRIYKLHDIRNRITHQQSKYSWSFVYLGANQDAILTAKEFGFAPTSTITYAYNSDGVRSVFSSMSDNLCSYRMSDDSGNLSFNAVDYAAQIGAGVEASVPVSVQAELEKVLQEKKDSQNTFAIKS